MIRSNQYGDASKTRASQPSSLMTTPGGTVSKQQQDWYTQNSKRPQTQPTTTTTTTTTKPKTGGTSTNSEMPNYDYSAWSTIQSPRYIQDSTTQDAINNTMAQGHANSDQRFQVKNLDRAGVSRGAGQNFMAAQEGVQQMQKASESASEVEAADQEQNSKMRSDFQKNSEMEAQNNAMIQHQLAQTEWAKKFAEESMQSQLEIAQQQAMLQLQLTLLR